MSTVAQRYKLRLQPGEVQEVLMPAKAELLGSAMKGAVLYVWANVEPTNGFTTRRFVVFDERVEVPPYKIHPVGLALQEAKVYTVWEVIG